jgi:tRNA A58 N-methylase Trm61
VTSNDTKQPISLVKLAHNLVKDKVKSGDIVIDATVGNGHDTRFLLELVCPKGKVFGFDSQQAAIASTRASLQDCQFVECVTLVHNSHADMGKFIPTNYQGKISAVMFNLGYLPGGDKRVVTQTESTLAALASASHLLSANGIVTVLAYPGHEGGEIETDQVKNWCLALDPRHYTVKLFENHANKTSAPKLLAITRIP